MRELADLMNDALAERSQSLTDLPTAQVGERLHRKVRFRRARRHTFEAGGVTAAVAVLGAATWLTVDRGDPAPAVSPTVSATPTPTSTPTPSTTPTPTSVAVAVADDILGLPPTYALPAGLLQRTTPGWVLSTYRSESYPSLGPVATHTVVLSSPAGELYRVVDLPTDSQVRLLAWEAGTTSALVSVEAPGSDDAARAVLDLTTGTISPDDRLLGATWYVGRTVSGAELWLDMPESETTGTLLRIEGDGAPEPVGEIVEDLAVDPAGRLAVTLPDAGMTTGTSFALLDLVDGNRSVRDVGVEGRRCHVVGWLDDQAVLLWCWDGSAADAWTADARPGLWRWDITADQPAVHVRDVVAGEPYVGPWSGEWVRDGVVAFGAGTVDVFGCWSGAYTWGDGTFTLVEGPGPRDDNVFWPRTSRGDVYVEAFPGCSGESEPGAVTVHRADGTSALLLPVPPATGEVPLWATGLSSWVVGTGR